MIGYKAVPPPCKMQGAHADGNSPRGFYSTGRQLEELHGCPLARLESRLTSTARWSMSIRVVVYSTQAERGAHELDDGVSSLGVSFRKSMATCKGVEASFAATARACRRSIALVTCGSVTGPLLGDTSAQGRSRCCPCAWCSLVRTVACQLATVPTQFSGCRIRSFCPRRSPSSICAGKKGEAAVARHCRDVPAVYVSRVGQSIGRSALGLQRSP